MQQGWYSVIGRLLDIAGFALIIWQWILDWRSRRDDVLLAAEKYSARALGAPREPNEDDDDFDFSGTMWNYGNLVAAGMVGLKVDLRLVALGAVFVVLGFAFQIVGSWPR